jgi:hypothetical protein
MKRFLILFLTIGSWLLIFRFVIGHRIDNHISDWWALCLQVGGVFTIIAIFWNTRKTNENVIHKPYAPIAEHDDSESESESFSPEAEEESDDQEFESDFYPLWAEKPEGWESYTNTENIWLSEYESIEGFIGDGRGEIIFYVYEPDTEDDFSTLDSAIQSLTDTDGWTRTETVVAHRHAVSFERSGTTFIEGMYHELYEQSVFFLGDNVLLHFYMRSEVAQAEAMQLIGEEFLTSIIIDDEYVNNNPMTFERALKDVEV